MGFTPEVFEPEFAQRALLAVVLAALAGGVIGSWIVLHDLAFFTHSAAAGAYPLVVLAPAGAAATELSAFAGALLFAAAYFVLVRRTAERDLAAGLLLTAFLTAGAIAAHARGGGRSAEALFFGSALTVDAGALVVLAVAGAGAVALAAGLGSRWTAAAFDQRLAGAGAFALVAAVALVVAAALPTLGALLVAALAVVPSATARLYCRSVRSLVATSVAIGMLTAVAGLWIALELDLAPGAVIALLGAGLFALAATAKALRPLTRRATPAAAAAVLFALLLAGCGGDSGGDSGEQAPLAVATTPVVADLAAHVAGRGLEVESLLEPGVDPHHFEPKPSDIAALEDARVVIRSGGELDAWISEAVEASGSGRRPVDLSSAAVLRQDAGTINPHWFLDPPNVVAAAERLRIEFTKAAPQYRETYRANAHKLETDFRALDRWARSCLSDVPPARRKLVTGHNAFDYLAARYDIKIVASLAGNDADEPSAEAVADAIRAIGDQDVPAVAVAAAESNGVAKRVADESGARLVTLRGDTLPKKSSTLLETLRQDISALAAAFGRAGGCPVPR